MVLALPAKTLVIIPVIVDANCSQVQNSLGTGLCPTHAGFLHPVLDQVTASAFNLATPLSERIPPDKLLFPEKLRRMLPHLKNIECKPPFKVGNDPKRQQKGSFV